MRITTNVVGLSVSQLVLTIITFYEYKILKHSVSYTNYLFTLAQTNFTVQELKKLVRDLWSPLVRDRTRHSFPDSFESVKEWPWDQDNRLPKSRMRQRQQETYLRMSRHQNWVSRPNNPGNNQLIYSNLVYIFTSCNLCHWMSHGNPLLRFQEQLSKK